MNDKDEQIDLQGFLTQHGHGIHLVNCSNGFSIGIPSLGVILAYSPHDVIQRIANMLDMSGESVEDAIARVGLSREERIESEVNRRFREKVESELTVAVQGRLEEIQQEATRATQSMLPPEPPAPSYNANLGQ